MVLGKTRGRKPSKKTVKLRAKGKLESHWLDCKTEDCLEGANVDGDVITFTCALCVCNEIPWQLPKPLESQQDKLARLERKAARVAKKEAIAAGTWVEPEKPEKLGFGRGWHRRITFSAEIKGEMQYFSKGKKITKTQYTKLERAEAKKLKAKDKPTASFGRGWHFMKEFIAPNGDKYECGRLVLTASKQPTLDELQSLMMQHKGKEE